MVRRIEGEKQMGSQKVSLTVRDALRDDVYKDIARVHWSQRGSVRVGSIAKVCVDGKKTRHLAVRGLADDRKGEILLDHVTRDEMQLKEHDVHNFTFEPTTPWQKVTWACNATDPAARIAAWIAVWSFVIGVAGLLLALYPIVKEILAR
jgi:hypothetical protein